MPVDDLTGAFIAGKFRVESALAHGGMGAVYVAVQEPLGRKVALKVIRVAALGTDGGAAARERFEREARIVARLRSSHIVTLYDFGEHDGAPYIVMELLDGVTLRARLNAGPLPVGDALSLVRDVACGLRAAHEAGVVHRDLKPENIIVVTDPDRGDVAKLLDFGVARLGGSTDATQTAAGLIVGTPGYIAPELALHGVVDDPRSDLYALGVVLYEALCGSPPFSAATPIALVMQHATQAPPDPCHRAPAIPAAVGAVVLRLLEKDPARRPSDAAALIAEIDRLRAAVVPAQTESMSRTGAVAPRELPSRPSIAVQPFAAPGGSDDDVILAESISEDVLVALSSFKQLFVVAQTSTWKPSGRDTDALRVGRTLGVRYVLQASVRRAADRLRVNAVLVDTVDGRQVWAQRFDRDVSDLFAVQDELVRAIVACVVGRVERAHAESALRKPPIVLDAYEWFARGRAHHHRNTREDNAIARAALENAVKLDPDYAQAHAWCACAYGQAIIMTHDNSQYGPMCAVALGRALVLDESDSETHYVAAELAMHDGDIHKVEHHHNRALELNPNDARIVGQHGEIAIYYGRFDDAEVSLRLAVRLDPLGPKPFLRHIARAHYMRDRLADAWSVLKGLDEKRPDIAAMLAAVAALQGNMSEAERYAASVRAVLPDFDAHHPSMPRFASAELTARWERGFVAAGLA